jgi:hypothetical protein
MKKNLNLLLVLFFCLSIASCKKESSNDYTKSTIQFSYNTKSQSDIKSAKVAENAKYIVVSIVKDDGTNVINSEKIALFNFNGVLISNPVSLLTGDYELSQFLILDSADNVILATPFEGSEKAYLVNDPLNISFTIEKDVVCKLIPEVLSLEGSTPEQFGYATFSFSEISTLNFLVTTFIYDASVENFILTTAAIKVSANSKVIYNGNLEAITNNIAVNDEFENYTIEINKEGYKTYLQTFTNAELKLFFSSTDNGPLKVILEKQDKLILQPGSEEGIDAVVCSIIPDENRGTTTHSAPYAWTQEGILNIVRPLIDFNLKNKIKQGTTIKKASLYLYFAEYGSNKSHAGENAFYIKRITSPWEELSVTWNNQPNTTDENQVLVPKSENQYQDYVIDVTALIQDIINNPENSYGIMLQLVNETPYNKAMFASSDNANSTKWPKLVIEL